jgi:hypothetical protein
MNARYLLTALLSLLIVAALAFIGWETDWGRALRGEAPDAVTRVATLDTNVLPQFQLPPLDASYKETIERPLFLSARRPAPPSNLTTQVAMKKGQFKLAGTTVSAGVSVAYLVETANNKTHRVNMGADINGIKVERVEATRVVMKQGDEIEELTLRSSISPKLPPPQQVAAVSPNSGQPGQPTSGMPGVPGGNFGPPLPQNQQGQQVPGLAPNQMAPGFIPNQGVPPQVAGVPQQQVQQQIPGQAVVPPAPSDPNGVQMRRRRFQNLPQ